MLTALAISFNNLSQSFIQAATGLPNTSKKNSSAPVITTSTQEKKQIDNLSTAADYLSRAAGVFESIAAVLLSNTEGQLGVIDHDTGDPDHPLSDSVNRKVNLFKLKSGRARESPKAPLECYVEVNKGLSM